jgi:heme/copper-type cytochrome/quinol oxidase subunit 4
MTTGERVQAGTPPAGHAPAASGRAVTITWLLLVAATVAGWLLSGHDGAGGDAMRVGAILLLAAIKIHFVIAVFMGLRDAPMGWRMGVLAWIVLTFSLVGLLVAGVPA